MTNIYYKITKYMKGLTFFKLISPYKEDRTKNCGLLGTEIDDNFFNLKENDIKDAYLENDTLVMERINGDIIRITGITEGCAKDLDIKYDAEQGALIITNNGATTMVTGFTTPQQISMQIFSDNTIDGKGTMEKPLSLSPLFMTGQYKPATKVIDMTKNERLPDPKTLSVGDRYVTIESISDFGYLYDYNGVSKISADLRDSCSPWRVPTKEDWDNMLNAVEPRVEDRNHDKVNSNKYLGRFAGKLLKSVNFWKLESNCPDPCDPCNPCNPCINGNCAQGMSNLGSYSKDVTYDIGCEEQDPYCEPVCGTIHPHTFPCKPDPYPNRGIDKYGFAAVPAGYGDDGNQINYFGERGWYWTATNSQCLNAYTKRFEYDKSTVFQEIIGVNNLLSLRLVKDYDGDNYNERENILGCEYSTVLMPSKDGKAIWTSTNIAFTNRYYNPVAPNNGIGLTYTKKFFINEWNGKRWLKNELRDGESIVFHRAPNGENDVEYRAINGQLVNVSELVYDNVIETVKPDLDEIRGLLSAEVVRAKEAERNLQVNIDTETARAVQAENRLQSNIDSEVERAVSVETDLQNQINEEVQNRVSGDEKNAEDIKALNDSLVNAITTITEKVTEGFNALANSIVKETEERKSSDEALNTKIESETQRATEAEQNLSDRIDLVEENGTANLEAVKALIKVEEDRAIEAELKLDEKIAKVNEDLLFETERALDAEEDLNAKIDAEIERSTTKDIELENKVNTIDSTVSGEIERLNVISDKLDAEIDRSVKQDELITERLIETSGHTFSASEGKMVLNTINPENKITVELDFDFGTF